MADALTMEKVFTEDAGGGQQIAASKLPTHECTRIVDAFADFVYDESHQFTFDIFVEVDKNAVYIPGVKLSNQTKQIEQVRKFLGVCIQSKSCPVRVHWSDPAWVSTEDVDRSGGFESFLAKDITQLAHFNNRSFKKELAKVNDELNGWPDWIKQYAADDLRKGRKDPIHLAYRVLMDVYAVSRIVKPPDSTQSALQNVIYYAGAAHTRFAATLLERLGFKETWTMGENACLHNGTAVRQMPFGAVFEPPAISKHRHSKGEVARAKFDEMCDSYFGSKKLVKVIHSARWFNADSAQTVYFIGEIHGSDNSVESGEKEPNNSLYPETRKLNLQERDKRVADKVKLKKEADDLFKNHNRIAADAHAEHEAMQQLGRKKYRTYKNSLQCLETRLRIAKAWEAALRAKYNYNYHILAPLEIRFQDAEDFVKAKANRKRLEQLRPYYHRKEHESQWYSSKFETPRK